MWHLFSPPSSGIKAFRLFGFGHARTINPRSQTRGKKRGRGRRLSIKRKLTGETELCIVFYRTVSLRVWTAKTPPLLLPGDFKKREQFRLWTRAYGR